MIPLSEPVIGDREREWINRCLDSGFVSSVGDLISEFEQRFARRVGARYAVATASGTAALHVALRVAGIGPGDVVAVADLTFVASVNPVLYQKGRPLLVDVDPSGWCMDVGLLERYFEEQPEEAQRIKAVVPVHLYGGTVDMPRLMALAKRHGFAVVEDATEALGTTLNGQSVGTFGDLGCFSFNGNKMITTGSGGMIVTQSQAAAEQARYLVNQARDPGLAYQHGTDGYNYRMTNLHAALGLAQLERLDGILEKKKTIARCYQQGLQELSAITLPAGFDGLDHCYWLYSVLLETPALAETVRQALCHQQIQARPFFLPLHQQPYLTDCLQLHASGWQSDQVAGRGLNLPSSVSLTEFQQNRVIREVQRALL
jgi:perosamine synthetase